MMITAFVGRTTDPDQAPGTLAAWTGKAAARCGSWKSLEAEATLD
jgi:hypothetical protein